MKKITFVAALFAAFSINAQVTVFEDSFEDYPDFEIATIGEYSQIDVDGFPTFGSQDFDFTNEGYVGTGIIFNPSLATPDPNGGQTTNANEVPNWQARTGDKGLWFFAANNATGTNLNDDYFITPQISLEFASGSELTFYAKSLTDNFGEEQIEVLLSTTGTDVADFTNDLGGEVIFVPVGTEEDGSGYNQYTFDLSAYDGQDVYIAIHYIAADSFILQVDDIAVTAETLSTDEFSTTNFTQYFNVSNNELVLNAATPMQNVKLFNTLGQEVVNRSLSNTEETVSLSDVSNGIYIAQVAIGNTTETFKLIKR